MSAAPEGFEAPSPLHILPAYDEEEEEQDFEEVVDWLQDRNWEFEYRACLKLTNMVRALIYGGRPLNIPGDPTANEYGLAQLEPLQECTIQCAVWRKTPVIDGRERLIGLYLPHEIAFLGYDEEGRTAPAHVLGPRQVGPPPDIILRASTPWVLRLDDTQREAALVEYLGRIGRAPGPLRAWNKGSEDIRLSSLTLQLYGPVTGDALAAVQAAQGHIDTRSFTDAQLAQIARDLPPEQQYTIATQVAQGLGYQFYRPEDGAVIGLDGEQVQGERDDD